MQVPVSASHGVKAPKSGQRAAFEVTPFGRFYLLDRMATGGMAEIFRAKTFAEGGYENLLVIKRILPHISENEEFIEMFIDEARVCAALKHPNIVNVHDFGQIGAHYFLAMEYIEGSDVRKILRKLARARRRLPARYAAYIAREVALGLHHAHTRREGQDAAFGIIHRDVSPANVLLSFEGRVKIVDFGIAKALSNAYQTRDGVLKGKFDYMSPEQADGEALDARSDLFALGIVLWEMVTGRRLFKTPTDMQTLKKVRNAEVPPPSTHAPHLNPEFEALVMRLLSKDPGDRFESGKTLADELALHIGPEEDETRDGLSSFLQELFETERVAERQKLDLATDHALHLHERRGFKTLWGLERTLGALLNRKPAERSRGVEPAFILGVLLMATLAWALSPLSPWMPSTATVEILVVPEADLYIDEALRGSARTHSVRLEPGPHVLRLKAEGYQDHAATVVLDAGDVFRLAEELVPIPPPPTPVVTPPYKAPKSALE